MNRNLIRTALIAVVFIAICAWAAFWAPSGHGSAGKWYGIIPPLLAIFLAVVTRQLILSLAAAVIVGGLLAEVPGGLGVSSWLAGLGAGAKFIWAAVSDKINIQILAFVALVMAMIAVILVSGGMQAVVRWMSRFARGPRSTQIITALMGLAVFIDDYANTMIVGSAMRPLSDKNKVSREKLAFLVDATSAPVAGVAVISTWIGYEVGLFGQAAKTLGLERDGYSVFFDILTYRFYCLFMIGFVIISAIWGREFGPMAEAEERVRFTGEVAAADAKPLTSGLFSAPETDSGGRQRISSALVPIGLLFAVLLGGLWWDGGGLAQLAQNPWSWLKPSMWRDVLGASENNILILAVGAGVGLLAAIGIGAVSAGHKTRKLSLAALGGLKGSLLPIVILVLAWSLKGACDKLGTGVFLVNVAGGVLSPVWFPALVFTLAAMTAFATGTSWGTMAILIPSAAPIAFQLDGQVYGVTTILAFAAVLDGAIFGDHCSPISDTTIMSSIATSCDHVHHVRTQLPYALLVAVLAVVCGYLPAALGLGAFACFGLGFGGMGIAIAVLSRKRTEPASAIQVSAGT